MGAGPPPGAHSTFLYTVYMPNDLPIKQFATQAEFETWLADHYADPEGVWLKFAKKNSGVTTTNYAEALDIALQYGWIDGQSKTVDETFYLQRFTPRRPKSVWSQRNVKKVEEFIKQGTMKPSGMAAVEAAKQDGRWAAAYEAQSTAEAPADFLAELSKHKAAEAFYNSLTKANKYAFIYRLHHTKPEKRQEKIATFVAMLAEGKAFH